MCRVKHRDREYRQQYKLSPIVIALLSTIAGSSYAAQNDLLPRLASEMSRQQQGQELKRQGKLIEAQGQAIIQLKSQLEALNNTAPSKTKSMVKPNKNVANNKSKQKPKNKSKPKIKPVGKAPPKKPVSTNVPDLSTVNNKVGAY